MKSLTIGLCVAAAAMLTGCVVVGPTNAASLLTLEVTSPDTNFIDNSVKPAKCGEATADGILCFTRGNCSIKKAMENGGINKIHHVDYKVNNILGIIGSTTTIVYGE